MAFAALEVVHAPSGVTYLVRATPKGGLKDVVASVPSSVGYISEVPGEVGLLGRLINKIAYRGRYVVEVSTIDGGRRRPALWSEEGRNLRSANAIAAAAVAQLNAGTAPEALPRS